jgi:hypothetical protein
MFKNISIRGKLTTMILFLVVVTICTSGYISYSIRKNMLQESYLQNLNALLDVKEDKIKSMVSDAINDITLLASLEVLQLINKPKEETDFLMQDEVGTMTEEAMNFNIVMHDKTDPLMEMETALQAIKNSARLKNVIITDANGDIILSTDPGEATNIRAKVGVTDDQFTVASKAGRAFSKVFKKEENYFISVGAPIGDFNTTNALCFIIIDINPVFDEMLRDMGYGETVETIIAQQRKDIALFLNPTKFNKNAALDKPGEYRC